jgi:hypothetical protein
MAMSVTSTRDRSSLYPNLETVSDSERLADLFVLIDGADQHVLRASVELLEGKAPSIDNGTKWKVSNFLQEITRLTGDSRFSKYVDVESNYYVEATAWRSEEDDEGQYYTAVNEDGSVRADVYPHEGQFYWTVYYDGQSSGFADGYAESLKDARNSAEEIMNSSSSPFTEDTDQTPEKK